MKKLKIIIIYLILGMNLKILYIITIQCNITKHNHLYF